jgi:uncharacterized membrane protein YdjX (TVP38/TMEM64 family)
MDPFLFDWLPIDGAALGGALQSDLLVAGLLFLGTAALVALCVPGIVIPVSITSGAVLGPWAGTPVVALGALLGSQILFLVARRLARERVTARLGKRLDSFRHRFAAHGIWYVIGLRLVGAPHFLITAGSALMPMRAGSFAVATLLGLLPVIAIASAAGSSF